MSYQPEELAFRARALAQAHPLTAVAKRYLDRAVAAESEAQPLTEFGNWAGTALLSGYCVRRVVEEDDGAGPAPGIPGQDWTDLDALDEAAGRIAADLTTAPATDDRVIAALDRVVASEVSRRYDNYRESVDAQAWAAFEQYVTWWVVRGYALRAAEMAARAGLA